MKFLTKRHGEGYAVFAGALTTEPVPGSEYRDKKDANAHRAAMEGCLSNVAHAMAEFIAAQTLTGSAIQALQDAPPVLTTRANVIICKTGIEYPLSSGPTTFTPEDLAHAVGAQDDPAITTPRIWLGHPDDPRIHGKRAAGGPPSGEPAIGRVTNMRLVEDGNAIMGDYEGIPLWLDRILASAYPARSIEGNFDVETVTGHKWRLVINGLALLGVVWPGVSTLEDIASLYTEAGPADVEVINASEEQPVTVIAAGARQVVGQVTVEDLRRQYYESLTGDQAWWWIRAIYLDPNELIVDDDDGSLYRVTFDVNGDDITFAEAKAVKVKYVNASNGGVTAETVNPNRVHVALFASRAEARPGTGEKPSQSDNVISIDFGAVQPVLNVDLGTALSAAERPGDVLTINLKETR
jgi:hypothetical protein